MDTEIVKELLRQYGLAVTIIVTVVIGIGFILVNYLFQRNREKSMQRLKTTLESQQAESLEHLRATLEKQLAEYKATTIKEAENVHQSRWEIKYHACLDALDIVDAILAQYFDKSTGYDPVRAPVDTIRARKCQSSLSISCESPKVAELFTAILFPKKEETVGAITKNLNLLRNAIRNELGFGEDIVFPDHSWIVRLKGDMQNNEADTQITKNAV